MAVAVVVVVVVAVAVAVVVVVVKSISCPRALLTVPCYLTMLGQVVAISARSKFHQGQGHAARDASTTS